MTIYEIKRLTENSAPYFFSRKSMKFFGQTLKDFRVKKLANGKYYISAPAKDFNGKYTIKTERIFNPENNTLEHIPFNLIVV